MRLLAVFALLSTTSRAGLLDDAWEQMDIENTKDISQKFSLKDEEKMTKAEKKWYNTEYHVHMGHKQVEQSAKGDHRVDGNKIDKKKFQHLRKNIERVEYLEHGLKRGPRFERALSKDLIGGEDFQKRWKEREELQKQKQKEEEEKKKKEEEEYNQFVKQMNEGINKTREENLRYKPNKKKEEKLAGQLQKKKMTPEE